MTINLELTPDEWAALSRKAAADGATVEAVLHGLIAPLTGPPTPPGADATRKAGAARLGLLGAATGDAEEQAEREREQAEMQNNIRRWREEQAARPGRAE